jgi:hypothetical protein
MQKSESRKSGGGKLARTEIVTVRLDPQLRYLIELAARKQRRTVSSYIEWTLEESLSNVCIGKEYSKLIILADEKHKLWDVDEVDRFIKLAFNYPELLNHSEQVLWKLLQENGSLWKGRYGKYSNEWEWEIDIQSLIIERLRRDWEKFTQVAAGESGKDILPTWIHQYEEASSFDDDVPF